MPNHPDPLSKPEKRATGQPDAIAYASTRLPGFDFTSPEYRKAINAVREMITLSRKDDFYIHPDCTC